MQTTINLDSINPMEILTNPTTDKTLVIINTIMKLENSTNSADGITIKYSDGTQVNLSTAVPNDNIFSISDTGSQILTKIGQDIHFNSNEGFPYSLSGNLTMIVNYELI
jgi:hypothetical protein